MRSLEEPTVLEELWRVLSPDAIGVSAGVEEYENDRDLLSIVDDLRTTILALN